MGIECCFYDIPFAVKKELGKEFRGCDNEMKTVIANTYKHFFNMYINKHEMSCHDLSMGNDKEMKKFTKTYANWAYMFKEDIEAHYK